MSERPIDIRPYAALPSDLCGRCGSNESAVVARRYYASGWVINICGSCMTAAEIDAGIETLQEANA